MAKRPIYIKSYNYAAKIAQICRREQKLNAGLRLSGPHSYTVYDTTCLQSNVVIKAL